MIGIILLTLFVIAILGSLPIWPYSQDWGYRPAGILVILTIMCSIAIFVGRIPTEF